MLRILAGCLPLIYALCIACGTEPPVVGYDGPLPSVAARGQLDDLMQRPILRAEGEFAVGTWTIESFGVLPNSRTGKGPVALVSSGHLRDCIPLLTDGDVADLSARVDGSAPDGLAGTMSVEYRAVWQPRTINGER